MVVLFMLLVAFCLLLANHLYLALAGTFAALVLAREVVVFCNDLEAEHKLEMRDRRMDELDGLNRGV